MKHIKEYQDWKWWRNKNPFPTRSKNIILVNCEANNIKSRIVEDLIIWLRNKGFIVSIISSGEGKEVYRLGINERPNLFSLIEDLPVISNDPEMKSSIKMKYEDSSEEVDFNWGWEMGFYKSDI